VALGIEWNRIDLEARTRLTCVLLVAIRPLHAAHVGVQRQLIGAS
jgi:hypothetical protein